MPYFFDMGKASNGRTANAPHRRKNVKAIAPGILPTRIVALKNLVFRPNNYNKHSDAQIKILCESLRHFGQTKEIVARSLGNGKYEVIAGEGLTTAALREGWVELKAAIAPKTWTPNDFDAYMIADNNIPKYASPDEAQMNAIILRLNDESETLARLAAGEQAALDMLLMQSDNTIERSLMRTMSKGYFENEHDVNYRKVCYRIELLKRCGNGTAIEMFAGKGQLTFWYKRQFKRVVMIDKVQHGEFVMDCKKFISEHLKEFANFDLVDFDDEGSPALEIRKFFDAIRSKHCSFALAFTDGILNTLKIRGTWTPENYFVRGGKKATAQHAADCEEIIKNFIERVAAPQFRIEWLALERNTHQSAVYGTCFVTPV